MSFLLFAGESYYAKGGFNDFQGCYHSVAEAREAAEENNRGRYDDWEWWHIICQETLDVVAQSNWQAHGCDEDSYCAEVGD